MGTLNFHVAVSWPDTYLTVWSDIGCCQPKQSGRTEEHACRIYSSHILWAFPFKNWNYLIYCENASFHCNSYAPSFHPPSRFGLCWWWYHNQTVLYYRCYHHHRWTTSYRCGGLHRKKATSPFRIRDLRERSQRDGWLGSLPAWLSNMGVYQGDVLHGLCVVGVQWLGRAEYRREPMSG